MVLKKDFITSFIYRMVTVKKAGDKIRIIRNMTVFVITVFYITYRIYEAKKLKREGQSLEEFLAT